MVDTRERKIFGAATLILLSVTIALGNIPAMLAVSVLSLIVGLTIIKGDSARNAKLGSTMGVLIGVIAAVVIILMKQA